MMRLRLLSIVSLASMLYCAVLQGYPILGSESRNIGRVTAARLVHGGTITGTRNGPGELLSLEAVDLRLTDRSDLSLPPPDPGLSAQLLNLLGDRAEHYSVAVLDLSHPDSPRLGEHRAEVLRNPGSVGKIAVALALFQALADAFPGNTERRMTVLRDTIVTADKFVLTDSHTVRFWDQSRRSLTRRPIAVGDKARLIEF
ncbi:MAG: hypothetical protein ACI8PT_000975, partial [Gammaproteobacteria bacterium]